MRMTRRLLTLLRTIDDADAPCSAMRAIRACSRGGLRVAVNHGLVTDAFPLTLTPAGRAVLIRARQRAALKADLDGAVLQRMRNCKLDPRPGEQRGYERRARMSIAGYRGNHERGWGWPLSRRRSRQLATRFRRLRTLIRHVHPWQRRQARRSNEARALALSRRLLAELEPSAIRASDDYRDAPADGDVVYRDPDCQRVLVAMREAYTASGPPGSEMRSGAELAAMTDLPLPTLRKCLAWLARQAFIFAEDMDGWSGRWCWMHRPCRQAQPSTVGEMLETDVLLGHTPD